MVGGKSSVRFKGFGYLFILLAICSQKETFAQNPVNTQYMSNFLPYNTAYSVATSEIKGNTTARLQWAGVEGAPISFQLNGSIPLNQARSAIGTMVRQDKFGVETDTEGTLFYVHSVSLSSESSLAIGINGGFRNYQANYSLLDPSDPTFSSDIQSSRAIIGASAAYFSPGSFFIGISLPDIAMSKEKAVDSQPTSYLTGQIYSKLGENIRMMPALLISYFKPVGFLGNISTTFYMGALGLGINYRTTKELAGIVSIAKEKFRFGYSFQTGVTRNISSSRNGTHEITLGIRINNDGDRKLQY